MGTFNLYFLFKEDFNLGNSNAEKNLNREVKNRIKILF